MKKINTHLVWCIMLAISLIFAENKAIASTVELPDGVEDGINYIDDNTVVLVLLAPDKSYAQVTGTFNDWALEDMNQTPDGEHFWIELDNLTAGKEYIYQYLVDGSIRISDPFAEKILDPYNDGDIPESTYPDLIEWTDTDKGLASVFQTAQDEYEWQVTDFEGPLQHHLITYELLIRDFTEQRNFQSVIDSIQYLKNLGINAIELLPVNEFDDNLGWGYNPSHYFAVDKFYGPKDKLKELVDVAHQNGIAIILDMVLNHSMNQSPLASLYWNSDDSQPAADNPWYNETAPHQSVGWGNDFNHESEYTQDFVDRVNKFWLEEYHVDGFRFDFTKGLTQTSTSDDSGLSAYDQSRVDIITRMADEIWETKEDAYIILEHWCSDDEENTLTSYGNGMLTWRKLHYNYTETLSGQELDNQSFGGAQADNRMVFMESHDEERIPYDVTNNLGSETEMMERMKLGAAFFYTIPGPKMMWMFEEQACNYSLYTCSDGSVSYTDDCKLAEKPFNWSSYMQDADRVDVYNTFSELLKLRANYDVFTLGYYEIDENGDGEAGTGQGSLRQIRIEYDDMDVVIMGNFGTSGGSIVPWFPSEGTWYNYFNEDYPTYEYTGQTEYYLAAGQWELFTSVAIDDSAILAPSNLSASVTDSDVTLTWVDNADNETAYVVERSNNSDSDFSVIASLESNTSTYSDTELDDGKYYYRVKATGENDAESDYSDVVSARVGKIEGVNVHFKNTSDWDNVYIYVFDEDTEEAIDGWEWPGELMEQEDATTWYVYTIEDDVTPGIVFNDGDQEQTDDLSRTEDGWYVLSEDTWYDECPGDCPSSDPVLTVDPSGQEFEGSIDVTLSATNDGIITYTLDGTDPANGTEYSETLTFTDTTHLRAIAVNDEGSSDEINEWYYLVDSQCDTVYYYNENAWSSVYIYTWDLSSEETQAGSWPGSEMTQLGSSDWYYWVNCYDDDLGIVFNNGDNGEQTDDLEANSGWYYYSTWYDECPGDCAYDGLTIYCYKPTSWSTAYLYFWNTTGETASTDWPGELMLDNDGDNWYEYTISGVECADVIFSDNGSSQTDDLTDICEDSYYNEGWVSNPGLKHAIAAEDAEKAGELQLYPNPFSGNLNIYTSENNVDVNIKIVDLSGQIVYSQIQNTGNGSFTINTNIPSGVYILYFTTDNNTKAFSIIRQ